MKIDLYALEVLETIVEQGSFAKAAQKLHKVPSALTYSIAKLEESLGVTLFDKSGHRAKLTVEGVELLRHAKAILSQCDQLEARIKAMQGGWEESLRVSYNDLIPIEKLLPLISEFEKNCPHTKLILSADRLNGTIDAVLNEDVNISIGASRDVPEQAGLSHFNLGTLEFVFAIHPSHPLAQLDEPLTESDIREHTAAVASDSSITLAKRNIGLVSGQKTITVNSLASKKALQVAGIAVGFLPLLFIQNEMNAKQLVIKKVAHMKPILPLTVLWRTFPVGKSMQWLLSYLRAHGSDLLE